jgi:hypothetical protein
MQPEEFVSAIKQVVETNSMNDVLINISQSSGTKVDHRIKYLIDWYKDLDVEGQQCVKEVIKESVSTTLFGFFCVLDGVRAIENSPDKGSLELYYVKGNNRTLLNDLNEDFLHDIYKSG